MAMKRTKADKVLRQADELESKLERRSEETPKKTAPTENFSEAAARIVSEATEED
jgi:hypothetical protein